MIKKRASGLLLHITSLPSKYGIGDLGPQAYKFVDFLAKAKQSYWQTLPLNPPTIDSPYSCLSAFAGNTLFISPDSLYRHNLLTKTDIQSTPALPAACVDYRRAISYKTKLLNIAYKRFKAAPADSAYELFCRKNNFWLDDYALFIALRKHFKYSLWCDWPTAFRDRKESALANIKPQLHDAIEKQKFFQYQFFKQWSLLKQYCKQHSVKIIGDIPIYLACDSADVWANQQIFKLAKKTKKPTVVSGVPPDCFCKTGQLWGNPLYDWPALQKTSYAWPLQRIKHNLTLADMIRIDHFRGLIAYWQVPAAHKTAAKGKWVKGPGKALFKKIAEQFPSSPIIAEDLGYITPAVKKSIEEFNFTTTSLLQHAFDGDHAKNPHRLHNRSSNTAIYTSTHDSNTIKGWFEKEATHQQKKNLFSYLQHTASPSQLHWQLIDLAMNSVAKLVIVPMQDILGLGSQARMNLPGTATGNWKWRLKPNQINPSITNKLAKLTHANHRI